MTPQQRRERAELLLSDFVSGPAAATEATARAIAGIGDARALILVEGVSDQIAVETLAARLGLDLVAGATRTVPIGGAQAIGRTVETFGPQGANLHLVGMCDAAEEPYYRAALADAGGRFHICHVDLEDELIRALGTDAVEQVLDANGDLVSFRILQRQPPWRARSTTDQLRRFFGAGARRKLRYALLLVDALDLDHVPAPLDAVVHDAARLANVPDAAPGPDPSPLTELG